MYNLPPEGRCPASAVVGQLVEYAATLRLRVTASWAILAAVLILSWASADKENSYRCPSPKKVLSFAIAYMPPLFEQHVAGFGFHRLGA